MSFFGGGKSQPATPSSQTQFIREAPGIEERKIELMDIARQVAQQPINLPDYQVAGLGALEQQGMNLAGTTGVGAGTVQQGINQINAAAAPVGQQQINQYLNPYQSYVTDEIGRQGQMMQNQISANAVNSGAFGGGREGVQRAEYQSASDRNRAALQAQLLQQGFGQAQGLAQQNIANQLQLGGAQQSFLGQDVGALSTLGAQNQALAQAQLSANQQLAQAQLQQPLQAAQALGAGITGLIAGYPGQTQQQISPSPSLAQTALGTGATLAGIYRGFGLGQ